MLEIFLLEMLKNIHLRICNKYNLIATEKMDEDYKLHVFGILLFVYSFFGYKFEIILITHYADIISKLRIILQYFAKIYFFHFLKYLTNPDMIDICYFLLTIYVYQNTSIFTLM